MSAESLDDRFHTLLSRYLDEENSEAETKELAELLGSSPERRMEMARILRIHGALTQRGSLSYDRNASPPPVKSTRPRRLRSKGRSQTPNRPYLLPLALAAALLLMALIWISTPNSSEKEERDKPIAQQNPVVEKDSPIAKSPPPIKDKRAPAKPLEKNRRPKRDEKVENPKEEKAAPPKEDPVKKDKAKFPKPEEAKPPEPKTAPSKPVKPVGAPRSKEKSKLPVICRVIRLIGSAKRNQAAIRSGEVIEESGDLMTGDNSSVTLSYADGSQVELRSKSTARLLAGATRLQLTRGEALIKVSPQKKEAPFQVLTPHGEATVLGTRFVLHVNEASTKVEVEEGKVRLTRKKDGKALVARARDSAEVGEKVFRKRRLPRIKRAKERILFRETFEKRSVGVWPRSFQMKNKESSGFVTAQRGSNKFMTCKGSNDIQRAYLPFDQFQTPFTLRYRVRLTGAQNSRVGLNLWNESDKSRYAVAYDRQGGVFKVYRGQSKENLGSVPMQLAKEEWHDMEVLIQERSIEVRLARRRVLFVKTAATLKISSLSLVSLGKESAEFDDIVYLIKKRR